MKRHPATAELEGHRRSRTFDHAATGASSVMQACTTTRMAAGERLQMQWQVSNGSGRMVGTGTAFTLHFDPAP